MSLLLLERWESRLSQRCWLPLLFLEQLAGDDSFIWFSRFTLKAISRSRSLLLLPLSGNCLSLQASSTPSLSSSQSRASHPALLHSASQKSPSFQCPLRRSASPDRPHSHSHPLTSLSCPELLSPFPQARDEWELLNLALNSLPFWRLQRM